MDVTDVRRSTGALELFLVPLPLPPLFFLVKQQEVNNSATNLLQYFLRTPVGIILFSSFNSVSVIIFTAVSCLLLSPCVSPSVPTAYISETPPACASPASQQFLSSFV